MNFITVADFIEPEEVSEILKYSSVCRKAENFTNKHIQEVNEGAKGWTVLCDLTQSEVSQTIGKFQGDTTVVDEVPRIFHKLAKRIAEKLGLNSENVFFQYIHMGAEGQVKPHYDAGLPGYVTYKCNVFVDGPEKDVIHVAKTDLEIHRRDLYCFEANFYKHWMDVSPVPRIHLSYGFIVPLADLGWGEHDSRVRLSNRIWKAYIG